MTVRYELPDDQTLATLAGRRESSITIYAASAPVVDQRERAQAAVRSLFDEAFEQLRARSAPSAALSAIAAERDRILQDGELWGGLSRSLAIFVAPGFSEVFVLPNRVDDALHLGERFTVGPLLRSLGQLQEAFAATVSANGWSLWHATPQRRAVEVELRGQWPADLAEANNLDADVQRGRANFDRSGGEDTTAQLELYAKRVAEAVRQELIALEADRALPLVVFAAEPLASSLAELLADWPVSVVRGAADRLGAAEVDEHLRTFLAGLHEQIVATALRSLADGDQGRVERDLAAIGRQAVAGAIDTLYLDVTRTVAGEFDDETGAVSFDSSGQDVLGPIALTVLARGGGVVAVRGDGVPEALRPDPAVAALRFAPAG